MDLEKKIYLLTISILTLFLLYITVRNFRRQLRYKKSVSRGYKKEKEAAQLLTRKGYEIISEQPELNASYLCNGSITNFKITPDYLVKKWWTYYYVEVKTGGQADLKNAKTRRQILEYLYASKTKKILFIDMEHKKIHKIARI